MKLKCIPEDFVVTELTDRAPTHGSFALYGLRKRSIGTLEALQVLQRSWNIAPRSISHAGLKDRHADTQQMITIKNGPRSDFSHDLLSAEYLGQTPTAIQAADITGNAFTIVLRSLSADDVARAEARTAIVSSDGYPNYFDQQRFGSLGPSLEFVAAKWCLKDYERATWLALAEHNRHDDAAEREQKQILRDHWGKWIECKQLLSRSHRRSVVTYLCDHPTKFRKAFALINGDLRGLFLSAFQSAVWNRMLAATLGSHSFTSAHGARIFSERQRSVSGRKPASGSRAMPLLGALDTGNTDDRTMISIGDTMLPFSGAGDISTDLQLPLPSARCKGLDPDTRVLCDAALQPYQMKLPEMKVHFPRDRWFSRGLRSCVIHPVDLTTSAESDERYRGRQKVTLSFSLPKGCYATMLIKALTGEDDSVGETTASDATDEGVSS